MAQIYHLAVELLTSKDIRPKIAYDTIYREKHMTHRRVCGASTVVVQTALIYTTVCTQCPRRRASLYYCQLHPIQWATLRPLVHLSLRPRVFFPTRPSAVACLREERAQKNRKVDAQHHNSHRRDETYSEQSRGSDISLSNCI